MNHGVMIRAAVLLGLPALLAGCGSVTNLRPADGTSKMPKATAAEKAETPQQLMTPSTQAQPDRQADLLLRSEVRADDEFDLPPGPQNGRPSK